jgi:hypothetical protein
MTRNERVLSIEFSALEQSSSVVADPLTPLSSTITCMKQKTRAAQPQFTERAVPRSQKMTTWFAPPPQAPSLATNTRVRTPNRLEKCQSVLRIQYFLQFQKHHTIVLFA